MIITEAFFTNIREKLLTEISAANRSITVAVAWFTDQALLAALVERQRAGVAVSLAVIQDAINATMPFQSLVDAGGSFYSLDGALMHNKFCVIDGCDVITGSYNWTYKAARENFENIVLTTGDYDLALAFNAEFNRITGRMEASTAAASLSKVVRRMQVIRNLIQLEEEEDLLRQARRLSLEWPNPFAEKLVSLFERRAYASALHEIETFLQSHAQLTTYADPRLAALKLEIRDLEYQLIAVEGELAAAEQHLRGYNHEFTVRLGGLVEEILRLKRDHAQRRRAENPFTESEYDQAQQRYDQFRQEQAAEKQSAFQPLDAEGLARLKKLYRQCAVRCHPDKVSAAQQTAAAKLFVRVQHHYEEQNLEALAALATQLETGTFHFTAQAPPTQLEELLARRQLLTQQVAAAKESLITLLDSPIYRDIAAVADWPAYWQQQERRLQTELTTWKDYVNDANPA